MREKERKKRNLAKLRVERESQIEKAYGAVAPRLVSKKERERFHLDP